MRDAKIKSLVGGVGVGALLAAGSISGAAYAQGGIKAGAFLVSPRIEVQQLYNDNVYTDKTGAKSSYITVLKPSVSLESQFDKHQLTARLSLDHGQYSHSSGDDYTDGSGSLGMRFDGWTGGGVTIGVARSELHEDRGSDNNTDGTAPLGYDTTTISGGLFHRKKDVSVNLSLKRDSYRYDSVEREGTTTLSNSDRNRDDDIISARLGYAVSPKLELFLRGNVIDRDYDDLTDRNGLKRDTQGYDVVAGIGVGIPGKFSGEFAVGGMEHEFDEATFADVSDVTLGGSFEFIPKSTIAIRGNANRTLAVSTASTASSLISTSIGGHVDWKATRNLTFRPQASYTVQDYQTVSGAAEKEEKLTSGGVEVLYTFTQTLYGGASYKFTSQTAKATADEYDQNVYMLRLGAKF